MIEGDSMLCRNSSYKLEQFAQLDVDFIGAPWMRGDCGQLRFFHMWFLSDLIVNVSAIPATEFTFFALPCVVLQAQIKHFHVVSAILDWA